MWSNDLTPVELTVVDTNGATYASVPLPGLGEGLELLPLIADPDTGMQVMNLEYSRRLAGS
jgi:hypothetical protein